MTRILESLAAAGPLALVLGVAAYKLWQANREDRLANVAEQKAERDRHEAQEDALVQKYIQLVEKLTTVMRGDGGPRA